VAPVLTMIDNRS